MKRGDAGAFAVLYERHKSSVYGYCVHLLRDKERGADATQEVFLKMHRGIMTLNKQSAFRSWLFAITRNTVFSMMDRSKHNVDVEEGDAIDHESPFELVVQDHTRDILDALVSSLKPIYREVIHYREYENLSYEEIAETIGIPVSSVKARLLKARRALVILFHSKYGRDDVC
jgi:RNA polymerase sigma-70 factor (ECF subfamily)